VALPIEDYALLGDTFTAALVGKDGSIDWYCLPRFDSPACFAALLGTPDNGRFLLGPVGGARTTSRRYLEHSLVLVTEHVCDGGTLEVTDLMPVRDAGDTVVDGVNADIVRIAACTSGSVEVEVELIVRFDYGSVVPWSSRRDDGDLHFVAGPDALVLRTPIQLEPEGFVHRARFRLTAGDAVPFVLTWHRSHLPSPDPVDPAAAVEATTRFWSSWHARSEWSGPPTDGVRRSLVTLKALTYAPSGGIVAAPTTSLPEHIGGVRNWDYRYCWLRDASVMLRVLLAAGHNTEACAWRDWLLRAVAGRPADMQVLYGPRGERRIQEQEIPWLTGYEGSRPVRVGNAAHGQLQLDVYGEVIDVLTGAESAGLVDDDAEQLAVALLEWLEDGWRQPDEGVWEVRGDRRQFTHSKVLAWVAFDRAARAGWGPDPARWRAAAAEVHAEVCARAIDPATGGFTQSYGARPIDAATLLIPTFGFLPADDPRVLATVEQVRRRLLDHGYVRRYETEEGVDGLPPGEGAFLPCTFWYADALALSGRGDEARAVFDRLLALRNDVGLLSEEVDPATGRLLGNFPQAWSHVTLIETATLLASGGGGLGR
jgi:GH15 family glucan-1,4-alpha-glucosidase